uniref:cytochrome b6/f complex 3.5 kDa subunit n=1 Tax=Adiantum capillus-veneris TaxID=13818 RepID=UPI0000191B12|nr:cytochrome b6/f complex 3.5 kDa subunit [Adiantum capillus-veneris]
MFTSLSYFAFLMLALTFTLALFVGLNKIQILQLITSLLLLEDKRRSKLERVFNTYRLLIRRTYQQSITS